MKRLALTLLVLLLAQVPLSAQVAYPPLMLRDEGINRGRMFAAINFTGALINCTWTAGTGTCNAPAIASTDLTDTANLPRLNALTNTFTSPVTTQNGGLSVIGSGVTSGIVMMIVGSSATPGANSPAANIGSGLNVVGNLGGTDTILNPKTTLVNFGATVNTATLNAVNGNLRVATSMANTTNPSVSVGIFQQTLDDTVLANTVYGLDSYTVSTSGNAAKTFYGVRGRTTSGGALTTGTQTLFGVQGTASSTNLAGGISNVYGGHFQGGGSVASGSINSFGLYVANALSMNTTGTSKNVGLFVETPTGADTNYAALFQGGLVGIGTVTPLSTLSINGGLHVGGDSDAGDNNALIDGTLGVTGAITGALTGNATTATTLQNARTIAGVSFNGSANIGIPSTGLSDTTNLARLNAATNAFTSAMTIGTTLGVTGSSAAPGTTGAASNGIVTIFASDTTESLAIGALTASPYSSWMQTHDPASGYYPLALNPLGGNVGIGTTSPDAKLEVVEGDIGISTQGNGLILKATDGATCYRVTVNNAGVLATASVTCP